MQRETIKSLASLIILPSLIVYTFILWLSSRLGIQPSLVLRDLSQTCNYSIFVGMISYLGVLLWAASAAICIFSSTSSLISNYKRKQLILIGGIFSLILCVDDLFLLHDRQQSFQDFLYPSYIIFVLIIILRFHPILSGDELIYLFFASFLLGLSIVSDIFQDFLPIGYDTVQIFEEGFKFLGIASWLASWWRITKKSLSKSYSI